MSNFDAMVKEGIYLSQGAEKRAARDRWMKTYLTLRGQKIYLAIIDSSDTDAVIRETMRAVRAGY